jgi:hypothetical protein
MSSGNDPFEEIAKTGGLRRPLEDDLYIERELTVLDRQDALIGKIAVAYDGRAMAFDLRGASLGIFATVKDATAVLASTVEHRAATNTALDIPPRDGL